MYVRLVLRGGGLKTLADMAAKNVSFLDGSPKHITQQELE